MKLRFGIPLTLALMAWTSWASGSLSFNLYYVLIGISAAVIAWDSRQLQLQDYRTHLALPPLVLAVAVVVAWPLMFPTYLRTRYRVAQGLIPRGRASAAIPKWIYAAGLSVIILAVAGYIATVSVRRDLYPVVAALVEHEHVQPHVNLQNGSIMTITVQALNAPTDIDAKARDIARRALRSYPRPSELHTINVVVVDIEKRGAMTVTTTRAHYSWATDQLVR